MKKSSYLLYTKVASQPGSECNLIHTYLVTVPTGFNAPKDAQTTWQASTLAGEGETIIRVAITPIVRGLPLGVQYLDTFWEARLDG